MNPYSLDKIISFFEATGKYSTALKLQKQFEVTAQKVLSEEDIDAQGFAKLKGFIEQGKPLFMDYQGSQTLFIHGSQPVENHVMFYIGEEDPFTKKTPDGFVTAEDLKEWIRGKGYSDSTKIVACNAGYENGTLNTLYNNRKELELGISEQGDNRQVSISE